jgi:hypothetical protein
MYKSVEMRCTFVGNIPVPKPYRQHMFMREWFDAEHIGIDPLTQGKIYFGDGCELACALEDKPELDIPF